MLKPNEAMIDEAARMGLRIGLVASFAPTLLTMPAEFPAQSNMLPMLADGAIEALDRGDTTLHDRIGSAVRALRARLGE